MNGITIVLVVLFVSFAWVWSRWLSPSGAWKNDHIDYGIGIVAGVSWTVNTLDIILTPNLGGQIATDYEILGALGLFVLAITMILSWVLLAWIFVRIRVMVGGKK